MDAKDIIEIIDALPEYIKYIYPGYLTIYLYLFFRAASMKDTKAVILKSIVISYLYTIAVDLINISSTEPYKAIIENIILILLAVFFSYMAYRLVVSKLSVKFFDLSGINTRLSQNEIEEIESQSTNGTWLCIYLKNADIVYEGFLVNREMESDKNRYIVLAMYRKYVLDESFRPQKPYIEDNSAKRKEKVILYYSEIERIEVRDTA